MKLLMLASGPQNLCYRWFCLCTSSLSRFITYLFTQTSDRHSLTCVHSGKHKCVCLWVSLRWKQVKGYPDLPRMSIGTAPSVNGGLGDHLLVFLLLKNKGLTISLISHLSRRCLHREKVSVGAWTSASTGDMSNGHLIASRMYPRNRGESQDQRGCSTRTLNVGIRKHNN